MKFYDAFRNSIHGSFLPYVEKPMRYTGGELNSVQKDLDAVTVHGVICFPDLYEIGMSHTGLQILYHVINKHPLWALSRAFCPWSDAEVLMRKLGLPLYTLEYLSPVKDADWIGFTLQYELQFTNVLTMLDLSSVPLESAHRTEHDPLIIAGGPCSANPEPMAPFIDAFVIGDGEDVLQEICRIIEDGKKTGLSRSEKLRKISCLQGIYVPAFSTTQRQGRFVIPVLSDKCKVVGARIPELRQENYPVAPIVPLMDVVHHRLIVEVQRGCTRGCRFCAAGYFYRPVRERSPIALERSILEGMETSGWQDIGLLSLSTSDYTQFTPLLENLSCLQTSGKIDVSLPSTRIDALTDEQLDLLQKVSPASSITVAPEAASERLRRVINKDFTNESIFTTVKRLFERNVQTLKLYFMIGLPTETDDDIAAIISMVSDIASMARKISGRKMVNVAISPFSPKAHTPFQWEAMEDPDSLLEKGRKIKFSLRHLKNVKVSYRSAEQTLLESIIARGDRAIADLIRLVWTKGARLDGWDEYFNLERWENAASELGISLRDYCKAIDIDQKLPWEFVTAGVSVEYLKSERTSAFQEVTGWDCRTGQCYNCGACGPQRGSHKVLASGSQEYSNSVKVKKTYEEKSTHSFLYRYVYNKGESVRFLGHLDMVAVFERAILASGFPVIYSQGFNKHARLSFGPPLPMGVEGLEEAFDILLFDSIPDDPFIINRWLPPQIKVIKCQNIPRQTEALNSSIIAAQYLFIPHETIAPEKMRSIAETILKAEQLTLAIQKKGKDVTKDIRPLIMKLAVEEFEGSYCWDATVSLRSNATCKPSELAKYLLPEENFFDFRVIRKNCFVEKKNELIPVSKYQMK